MEEPYTRKQSVTFPDRENIVGPTEINGAFSPAIAIDKCSELNAAYAAGQAAQPPQAGDLDVLRDELELLGSMLRAERITATVDNRKCTDEQLERCYALRDKISAPSPSVEQRVEEIGKVVEEIVREWHRKHGQDNCTHIEVHAVPSNWNALHRIAASHLTSLLSNK